LAAGSKPTGAPSKPAQPGPARTRPRRPSPHMMAASPNVEATGGTGSVLPPSLPSPTPPPLVRTLLPSLFSAGAGPGSPVAPPSPPRSVAGSEAGSWSTHTASAGDAFARARHQLGDAMDDLIAGAAELNDQIAGRGAGVGAGGGSVGDGGGGSILRVVKEVREQGCTGEPVEYGWLRGSTRGPRPLHSGSATCVFDLGSVQCGGDAGGCMLWGCQARVSLSSRGPGSPSRFIRALSCVPTCTLSPTPCSTSETRRRTSRVQQYLL
jgi:hypothetical protein